MTFSTFSVLVSSASDVGQSCLPLRYLSMRHGQWKHAQVNRRCAFDMPYGNFMKQICCRMIIPIKKPV